MPALTTTLLSHVFKPGAEISTWRTPEDTCRVAGAVPDSTPSTLICAPGGTDTTDSDPHEGLRVTLRSWRAPAPAMFTRLLTSTYRGALKVMVRSPAATSTSPGACPTSTPSTITVAATPPVSMCSLPGSFVSRSLTPAEPSLPTTSRLSAGR